MTVVQQETSVEELVRAFLLRYGHQAGPEGVPLFVEEQLGVEEIDPWQREVLLGYGAMEPRLSVRSCNNPGKTAAASWCAVHSLICRFPQATIVTAPSRPQIYDGLYREIKMWLKKIQSPGLLRLYEVKSERIDYLPASEESYLSVRLSKKENPEALQGVHMDEGSVLLILDEASGIDDTVFDHAATSMAGKNTQTLLTSNPLRGRGFFFDTHNKLKKNWKTWHIAAHVATGDPKDSKRPTKDFCDQVAQRHGLESNAYRAMVLGEFPLSDNDTIIPYGLAKEALTRDVLPSEGAKVVWGLDVARFGSDKTALCKRQGNAMLEEIKTWGGLDTMEVTGRIHHEWNETPTHLRPVQILADVLNMGAGVVDRGRELGLPMVGINVAETSSLKERFKGLGTELWWLAREWFEKRDCVIVDNEDEDLLTDLTGRGYDIVDSTGQVLVEMKSQYKKRLHRSPDRADAFVLTFAGNAATAAFGGANQSWDKPLKRGIKGLV